MNKLIFVEGIPGCGKSTNSQYVAHQLKENGYRVEWIHEGIDDHPLWEERDDYFNEDGYINEEYFDVYTSSLIEKFKPIQKDIEENDIIYVVDGAIFAGFINVYYKSDCPDHKTHAYFERLEQALEPMNPLLIYLNTDRVRPHTIETWEGRAMWGKKVVTESYGRIPHVKRGGYQGDDILVAYISPLLDQDCAYFEKFRFDKLSLTIDDRDYDRYHQVMLDHLGIKEVAYPVDAYDLEKYTGIFDNDRDQKNMFVKLKEGQLVCDWGQMNMHLQYIRPLTYNLRSYPIDLEFIEQEGQIVAIKTHGRQCFRRAGCSFQRVEETKYEIRR